MASDIRTLMAEIQASYLAAKHALDSPAIVAKHAFIQRKMHDIAEMHEKLQAVFGDGAMVLVIQIMEVAETKYELQHGENNG